MNAAEFEALLLGLLRQWRVEAGISVRRTSDALTADITSGGIGVSVTRSQQPFGIVWQVEPTGGRRLTHPSLIGCIRHLRQALAPELGTSRVVFARAGSR